MEEGRCSRLEALLKDPTAAAISNLSKVWGIGEKTALDLYKNGYKTVADLRKAGPDVLNANQTVGLRLFDDLEIRIPRSLPSYVIMI